MIDQLSLDSAWMVELHPKGGSQIRQARVVMSDHQRRLEQGKPLEWVAVAIRPDFKTAETELSRIRKEFRKKKNGAGEE